MPLHRQTGSFGPFARRVWGNDDRPSAFLFSMTSSGQATQWRQSQRPSSVTKRLDTLKREVRSRRAGGMRRRGETVNYHGFRLRRFLASRCCGSVVIVPWCSCLASITLARGHTSLEKLPSRPSPSSLQSANFQSSSIRLLVGNRTNLSSSTSLITLESSSQWPLFTVSALFVPCQELTSNQRHVLA